MNIQQTGQLIIYFDHKFKCFQVVKPSAHFDGNFKLLADAIAGKGGYYSYRVK